MRTTVRLDDDLFRRTKERAAASGRTITALIEDGLRIVLARPLGAGGAEKAQLPELPRSGAGGVMAGVNLDCSRDLYNLMDEPG